VRSEAIVTFGNAGDRGGSGAVCSNVDINGNGTLQTDEAKVRSVPCRITSTVPALNEVNDQVTLTDTEDDISVTGTVTTSNFVTDILGDQGPGIALLEDSGNFSVSVDVDPGADGGSVTNCASLEGEDGSLSVTLGTDPVTGLPVYSHDFMCGEGVDDAACSTLEFGPGGTEIEPGEYCTFSQGGWGSNPVSLPGKIRDQNFVAIYPSGLEVGILGLSGYSMKFTSSGAVQAYLPEGGPPAKLTSDLLNPTSSASGVYGGQVTALRLNVNYSAAGVLPISSQFLPSQPLGALKLCNFEENDPYVALDGLTISQVLAEAEKVLGGGASSYGYTVPQMNTLVEQLVLAFESDVDTDSESLPCGGLSAFAAAHLCE